MAKFKKGDTVRVRTREALAKIYNPFVVDKLSAHRHLLLTIVSSRRHLVQVTVNGVPLDELGGLELWEDDLEFATSKYPTNKGFYVAKSQSR